MKTLKEYLVESSHTFDYRIKIAGDLPPGVLDSLKKSLEKYSPSNISEPKKTPVQKSPAGFPELANQSVSIIDATFNYPATPQEITALWHQAGGNPNMIRIITKDYDDSVSDQTAKVEPSPILDKELPSADSEQKKASQTYSNSEVVGNSAEKVNFTVAGGKTSPAVTTNQLPINNKSPISGTNRIPRPVGTKA